MAFPSTLSTFTNPNATDKLNSPSHSSIEGKQNSVLGQLEAVIGVDGANSVVGTITSDLRNPDSGGGGHVQTANKGGTGQTSFAKGDLLVATSSSVLAKLTVGADGFSPVANSSVAAGIQWQKVKSKLGVSASVITLVDTVSETSLMSVVVPGSTLGTSNAINATLYVDDYTYNGSPSMLLVANYGSTTVASVMLTTALGTNAVQKRGKIEFDLLANASASVQRGNFLLDIKQRQLNPGLSLESASVLGMQALETGTAAIDSGADQTIGVTGRWSAAHASNKLQVNGYVVKAIT